MKRSNTLLRNFTHYIRKQNLFSPNQTVIIAVSGGIDSLVMLDLFAQLQESWNLQLYIAHINHQLRGKESDGDEKFVKKIAEQYGIPFYGERAGTRALAKKKNLQQTAREIRYSFFEKLKKSLKADCIATAHNANDNAETILFNLFRGSGMEGLAGIPPFHREKKIIRPLLFAFREQISAYAKERRLVWREDSSNKKETYSRNYIRKNLLPAIQKLNPSVVQTLNQEAEIFRDGKKFIDELLEEILRELIQKRSGVYLLKVQKIKKHHLFIQKMTLRVLLNELGIEPAFKHIISIIELFDRQKGTIIQLSKSWRAERTGEAIEFYPKKKVKNVMLKLLKPGTVSTKQFTIELFPVKREVQKFRKDPFVEFVDAESISFPIHIRSWKSGDSFIPLGMKGSKKLSDFFTDLKLTQNQKNNVPILESKNRIVWVGGCRLDDRFKITSKTKHVYQLSLTFSHGKEENYR